MLMTEKTPHGRRRFETPGTYCITVEGVVNPKWSEWMGGLQITTEHFGDGRSITHLVGRVADQAALSGILNAIYELHLTLLAVECLNDE